jgi:hypothetical protein
VHHSLTDVEYANVVLGKDRRKRTGKAGAVTSGKINEDDLVHEENLPARRANF